MVFLLSLVYDRDVTIINCFFLNIIELFINMLKLSSTFHPQINKQIGIVNQSFVIGLDVLIGKKYGYLDLFLPIVEFICNVFVNH
jgi:hypothetical protein